MTFFAKAHACGNDFLVVEGACNTALAVHLCNRHTSVGADGVEFLEWTDERSGRIRLANADGSIAEISGNGTRCVAAWMAHQIAQKGAPLASGATLEIDTDAGLRTCTLVKAEGHRYEFAAPMGVPQVAKRSVRLADGTSVEGVVVHTGNPHFVIFVEDENFTAYQRTWEELGREICFHADFPEQTNVEFVHILAPGHIAIRIFERGVGPTTSSGTGTCATASATIATRNGESTLRVVAPGGEQRIDWPSPDAEILLIGPAELICTGEAWRGEAW
ncbi:diaminopimelate epimerase [Silvibacterium dinghuense]|uniref:Diaminopimelate epimerase n=1 Tax=Silvibacterium dinghuense TaxID=1560006 RepID=A0A4Q1SB50_9BACT|nr:diaminopimelate epimerase [Silvibacterium dinghuense]RXS94358.1 diaminopimelate epimerase [Silvibacterium dinghuense]